MNKVWKCTAHWWGSRTSNPVWGANTVPGGFDSHALPPYPFEILQIVLKAVSKKPDFSGIFSDFPKSLAMSAGILTNIYRFAAFRMSGTAVSLPMAMM